MTFFHKDCNCLHETFIKLDLQKKTEILKLNNIWSYFVFLQINTTWKHTAVQLQLGSSRKHECPFPLLQVTCILWNSSWNSEWNSELSLMFSTSVEVVQSLRWLLDRFTSHIGHSTKYFCFLRKICLYWYIAYS